MSPLGCGCGVVYVAYEECRRWLCEPPDGAFVEMLEEGIGSTPVLLERYTAVSTECTGSENVLWVG